MYASTKDGSIVQINYTKRVVESVYKLHNKAINSIYVTEGMCVTGSDDHYLRVWPLDFSDYFIEAEHESKQYFNVASYMNRSRHECNDFR